MQDRLLWLTIILAGLTAGSCHNAPSTPPAERRVFAHYMPWFRAEKTGTGEFIWDHWQWYGQGPKHDPDEVLANGHRDIASVYYPLIGPYDERDPAVLQYQILTAKAAGIDGFIADWYGPGSDADQVCGALRRAAERYGFTVALCLEEKTFFPPYSSATTRAGAQEVMARQLEYVLDRYAASSVYLRYQGEPVILVFDGWETGPLGPNTLTAAERAAVLQKFAARPLLYVRAAVPGRTAGAAEGCYLWSADGRSRAAREVWYREASIARRRGQAAYSLGGCCPGFNDTGVDGWGQGPRVTDRRNGREYQQQWQDILRYRPDAAQVITWNDLEEGTAIEPTEEFRFRYVDLTEQYVAKYTGRPFNLSDNRWPLRLFQLRRAAGSIPDTAAREAYLRDLESFADAFAHGRRLFMGGKLENLERRLAQLTPGQSGHEPKGDPR